MISCATGPVRANSLIITVYGDMIAPHGGSVWLGSFINLVKPLGINDRLVRTSVFRLSKDGWLESRAYRPLQLLRPDLRRQTSL
jgi:DNA-binding transcriptional regulator PaaX